MEIAALAAIGVLAVVILLVAASRHGRRTDVFADVVAFEQARRALARDVPAVAQSRPDVIVTDERRSA
ncbi:MAG: hypothetical protein QOF57_1884 [Frankiaceae bacterium]|jgi:hypothetical protein|nr:hypothetical protein [Frankiaceae bacterium]